MILLFLKHKDNRFRVFIILIILIDVIFTSYFLFQRED
jgi:hypothetical protein